MSDNKRDNAVLIALISALSALSVAVVANWEKLAPSQNQKVASQVIMPGSSEIQEQDPGGKQNRPGSISQISTGQSTNINAGGNVSYVNNPKPLAEVQNDVAIILKQGMPYSEARKVLQAHGWQAGYPHPPIGVIRPENAKGADITVGKIFYDLGFREVEECSGSGMGLCTFLFHSGQGRDLHVTTGNDMNGSLIVFSWRFN